MNNNFEFFKSKYLFAKNMTIKNVEIEPNIYPKAVPSIPYFGMRKIQEIVLTINPKTPPIFGIWTYFVPDNAVFAGDWIIEKRTPSNKIWNEAVPNIKSFPKKNSKINSEKINNKPQKKEIIIKNHFVAILRILLIEFKSFFPYNLEKVGNITLLTPVEKKYKIVDKEKAAVKNPTSLEVK